ncbi:MAG TPA: right-handed parallel beta-helix repeat-containing protein, partial [Chitinophagaceae bacterium]|nr:right-handed parallel beta-helix repeat-containing protein [Chitinophagaceae bacterium]
MRKIFLLLCIISVSFNVFAKTWFVNQSISGSLQNGYHWATALKSLKSAIDSSKAGDTIKIAAGTYVPGNSLEASFVPKNQVVMLGGYSASDSTLPRNFSANKTILSGRYSTSGIGMVRHILRIQACDEFTVIDGFIIQEGHAYGDDPFENELGGGMIISHNSKLKIRNSVFKNNYSYDGGSAVASLNSSPSFLNFFFLNNDCFGDGTILLQNSSTSVSNCVFADNVAAKTGAIVSLDKGDALFSNCTFFRNSVESDGITSGCVSAKNSSTVTIRNSIFFANSTNNPNNFGFDAISYEKPEITVDNSIATISICILQNYTAGTQLVMAVNPLFKDTSKIAGPDNLFFTNDDGLQLVNPCSPALNIGNNSFASGITTDIISQPRIYNSTIDLGAYEVQSAPTTPLKTVYVNPTAAGNNSGSNWSNAFTTLQQALLYCADTIKVSAGTYYPSASNPLSSFVLKNKIVILGGYPNSGNPSDIQRDPLKNLSRLSGALPNSNGVKSLKIVYANRTDSTCQVDGFLISDAKSHNWDTEKTAIRIANKSNPVFRNCVVENNEGGPGAGLQVDKQSRPAFFSCKFINNRADQGGAFAILGLSNSFFKNCTFTGCLNPERSDGVGIGGAGMILDASASFDSCSFVKNFSNVAGGALYMQKAVVVLNNCSFYGNSISSTYGTGGNDIYQDSVTAGYYGCLFSDSTAINKGGSQYNMNCSPVFERCEFRNGRVTHGGVAYNITASPVYKNCVFYKNTASRGSVLYNIRSSAPSVINCIVSDNSGTLFYNEESTLTITNSTITRNSGTPVINNIENSATTIKNSILWANVPGLPGFAPDLEIQNNIFGASVPSVTTINNSVTQVYGTNGVNNNVVGVNPRLIDYYDADGPDNKFFTSDDGLRLSSCSPV